MPPRPTEEQQVHHAVVANGLKLDSIDERLKHIGHHLERGLEHSFDHIEHTLDHILKAINRSIDVQEKILAESKAQTALLQQIVDDSEPEPEPLTVSVTNVFSGDIPMADNVLVYNVGQSSIDTLTPFLSDGVTPSGGVVSNVVVTFNDPSSTAVVQPDNTILFTAVADSAGVAVGGSTSLTITDTDQVVSTWSIPFTVTTVGAPPPEQLTQSVVNSFSTPTP